MGMSSAFFIPSLLLIRSIHEYGFMTLRGGMSHFPHLRGCVSHAHLVFQCLKNTAGESLGGSTWRLSVVPR
jgi:hypothetical protein